MKRFNRSFIGLMEMCNTGYWTPADAAQKKIDELKEHIAIIEHNRSHIRLKAEELNKSLDDASSTNFKTSTRLNKLKREHRFIKGLLAFYLFKATVGIVIYVCSFIAG
jgi:septal ring factor EnvC (AmiA/AmiB activator)